jgi:hypothetical protein
MPISAGSELVYAWAAKRLSGVKGSDCVMTRVFCRKLSHQELLLERAVAMAS